jgi:hypothetical protein
VWDVIARNESAPQCTAVKEVHFQHCEGKVTGWSKIAHTIYIFELYAVKATEEATSK